jgi:two-component system response regulator FixJ
MAEGDRVYVVDDEEAVRESMLLLLEAHGFPVRCFASAEEFLTEASSLEPGCVLSDMRMPGMSGIELVKKLRERYLNFPVIVMTAYGEVPLAARALRTGAVDFIEKPFPGSILIDAVLAALQSMGDDPGYGEEECAHERFGLLSLPEREVMAALIEGKPNKEIAESLGISQSTVEVHRIRLMEKMNARSLSALVRMAIAAGLKV